MVSITKEKRWLYLIILVAIVLRIAVSIYMGERVDNVEAVFDQRSYDGLARRVLTGHGFSFATDWWPLTKANAPTAHWSFLYVSYLVAVYGLFGFHPLIARVIQSIIAGICVPLLLYRLGRRSFGALTGLAAAAISAVYIYFIFYSAALMTETFFMIGILWVLDLIGEMQTTGQHGLRQWFLLGVAMAMTVLLRQTFIPLALFVAVWLVYTLPIPRLHVLRGLAISAAVVILSIFPWTVRNYLVFHQFVLLNTNADYAFFWANHPVQGTHFMVLLPENISYTDLIPENLHDLDEAAMGKALMRLAIQNIEENPGRYILLSINRIKDQFMFWPTSESGLISNISRVGSFGLCLPFMMVGAWLAIRASWKESALRAGGKTWIQHMLAWLKSPVALWMGCFLLFTMIHLASWAAVRYRLPTDTILMIFAGLAVSQILVSAQHKFPALAKMQLPL